MLSEHMKIQKRNLVHLIEIVIIMGIGVLLGAVSNLLTPVATALVVFGLVFVVAATKRQELLLLVYLALTSTIIDSSINPRVNIVIGSIYLTDIIIFVSLGMIVLRALTEPGFELVHTPLDLPIFLFWLVSMASTFIAIAKGNATIYDTLGAMRVITGYLLFFLVTNLIRSTRHIHVLWQGMYLMAIITAVGMIAQYVVGHSVKILPGRVETLETEGVSFGSITRIIPPGESLIYLALVVFMSSILMTTKKSSSNLIVLGSGLLGLGVLLTYKRHLFVAFGIAVFILYFLITSRDKVRLLTFLITAIVVLGMTVFLLSLFPNSSGYGFVKATEARFYSLFAPQTYSDPSSSFQWRTFEYTYAFPQIESNPILGIGLDTIYRPLVQGRDYTGGDYRRFIHNGHVAVLLRTGFVGYILFMLFSVMVIWRGFTYWRDVPDEKFRALVVGSTLTYLGVIIGSIISPIIITANWTPVLAVIFGLNESIYNNFQVNQRRHERLL